VPMKPRDPEFDAIGQIARSAGRTKIVRYLHEHPGSYFASILEATDSTPGSLGRHLRDLEAEGIVVADLPMELRRGRSARWSIDEERLRALLCRFQEELLG
jgi:ArsR family transcriptional regulator